MRSTSVGRKDAGDGGRIASAGGMRAARRTERAAPRSAASNDTPHRESHEPTGHDVLERREPEVLAIEVHHARAHAPPREEAQRRCDQRDERDQLAVVQRELAVAPPERFEHRDLAALLRDEPRQHDGEQERRDTQEDRGEEAPHRLQLLQLVGDEPVRCLLGARHCAEPAVRSEHPIDRLRHASLVRAARERQHHVVERALHPERRGDQRAPREEHTEQLVVGHDRTRRHGVHELGRHDLADHTQEEASLVHDDGELVPRPQPVRLRERVGQRDLVEAPWLRQSPPQHVQVDEVRAVVVGERNETTGDEAHRPALPQRAPCAELHGHVGDHTGVERGDTWDTRELLGDTLRRALEGGEEVREPLFGVGARHRELQRSQRALHRDERRDTAGDDRGDRQELRAQLQDVPQQLPVEHAEHRVSSYPRAAATGCATTNAVVEIRMTG
jgi:hypothetical protein